ncbi:MAG: pyrroloquinoline quinone biosynthesis protein PqqE [Rickettsiales bacterium]|nr:pyrroloquinoline quinone biosynthesis protein PqqE [Rickettsiales bacterium]|tara:strand:+ start:504 stop:1649 length:1146 start_codon:yes stop_codon:yes gene_type:complete
MDDVKETKLRTASEHGIQAPLALLAELSHRCPLQCPYCSNPVQLEKKTGELSTDEWKSVVDQAVEMGMHQIHLSGGEPTVRHDLEDIVEHCSKKGLYTNLITSGVLLNPDRLRKLESLGLEHVQLSFQDTDKENADRIGGYKGGHAKKLEVAGWVRDVDLPLTCNCVVHRQNIDNLENFINMALELDAERVEIAQVQYYGWALKNRAAFIPTPEQLDHATEIVEKARIDLKGKLVIDYVIPDYYAKHPKNCMGGWGRRFLNMNPKGEVLPCHAAETIPHLKFDNVREKSLKWIWENSEAFNLYRGTDWMPEPCKSCDRKEIDWGGCRCQAMALTGDAKNTDPACSISPLHNQIFDMANDEARRAPPEFIYRRYGVRFNSPI